MRRENYNKSQGERNNSRENYKAGMGVIYPGTARILTFILIIVLIVAVILTILTPKKETKMPRKCIPLPSCCVGKGDQDGSDQESWERKAEENPEGKDKGGPKSKVVKCGPSKEKTVQGQDKQDPRRPHPPRLFRASDPKKENKTQRLSPNLAPDLEPKKANKTQRLSRDSWSAQAIRPVRQIRAGKITGTIPKIQEQKMLGSKGLYYTIVNEQKKIIIPTISITPPTDNESEGQNASHQEKSDPETSDTESSVHDSSNPESSDQGISGLDLFGQEKSDQGKKVKKSYSKKGCKGKSKQQKYGGKKSAQGKSERESESESSDENGNKETARRHPRDVLTFKSKYVAKSSKVVARVIDKYYSQSAIVAEPPSETSSEVSEDSLRYDEYLAEIRERSRFKCEISEISSRKEEDEDDNDEE